ncbi:MAG: hypothetical protein AAB947_00810 [Patescibacteria group bacterium]
MSLGPFLREYAEFVRSGNVGSFTSSIVQVKLPTPIADDYTKNVDGYATYIVVVYYDVNRNGRFDPIQDWLVGFADSYVTYIWDTAKVRSTVPGWNFELSRGDDNKIAEFKGDATLIEGYRKSFESSVMQMPILDSDTELPLLPESLPKM